MSFWITQCKFPRSSYLLYNETNHTPFLIFEIYIEIHKSLWPKNLIEKETNWKTIV